MSSSPFSDFDFMNDSELFLQGEPIFFIQGDSDFLIQGEPDFEEYSFSSGQPQQRWNEKYSGRLAQQQSQPSQWELPRYEHELPQWCSKSVTKSKKLEKPQQKKEWQWPQEQLQLQLQQQPITKPKPPRSKEEFLKCLPGEHIEAMRNADPKKGPVKWGGTPELIEAAKVCKIQLIVRKKNVNGTEITKPTIGESGPIVYLKLKGCHYSLIRGYGTNLEEIIQTKANGNCLFESIVKWQLQFKSHQDVPLSYLEQFRKEICDSMLKSLQAKTEIINNVEFKWTDQNLEERNTLVQEYQVLIDSNDKDFIANLQALPPGLLRDEAVQFRDLERKQQKRMVQDNSNNTNDSKLIGKKRKFSQMQDGANKIPKPMLKGFDNQKQNNCQEESRIPPTKKRKLNPS